MFSFETVLQCPPFSQRVMKDNISIITLRYHRDVSEYISKTKYQNTIFTQSSAAVPELNSLRNESQDRKILSNRRTGNEDR